MTDNIDIGLEMDAITYQATRLNLAFNRIPPAGVRGNSRKHHMQKAIDVRAEREFGVLIGLQMLAKCPGHAFPLSPYAIEIVADTVRPIDGDNLMIGYKPFIDGLVEAGVIVDDRHIKRWSIEVAHGSFEMTQIKIHCADGEHTHDYI